jgi:hypothetical protein
VAGRLWHGMSRGLTRVRWPLAGLVALVIILACVLVIPQWLVRWELGAQARTLSSADKAKAINDVRATLLQGVGGAVILLGAYFTYRQLQTGRQQLQIAEQGQVTERFTRAIDQLGHAELDVRLGGIYALERIANDSPDDRTTIAEVLTAFVRSHAPWPPRLAGQYRAEVPIEQVPELQVRAPDVQAALTVLGRRQPAPWPRGSLDLDGTDLRKARLEYADLQAASLLNANLQEAILDRANLQWAILDNANLQGAHLEGAQLQDAASTVPGSRARTLRAPSSNMRASTAPTSRRRTSTAPTSKGRTSTAPSSKMRFLTRPSSKMPMPIRIPPSGPQASTFGAPVSYSSMATPTQQRNRRAKRTFVHLCGEGSEPLPARGGSARPGYCGRTTPARDLRDLRTAQR